MTIIAALSGLFDENFNRGAGWVFYVMGRCVERGVNTCRLLRQFAGDDATEHTLGVMLDLIDSQITYRSRYLVGVARRPCGTWRCSTRSIRDRSCSKSTASTKESRPFPSCDGMAFSRSRKRLTTLLGAELATERAETLNDSRILVSNSGFSTLANAIAARYFLHGAGQGRAEKVTGLA